MRPLILSIGELLWDILPDQTILGGAPSNLAYRLLEQGNDCRIVSRVGKDQLGERALAEVSSLGLSMDFIQTDQTHPTGTVDVRFDADMNPDYVINPGVAYDFIEITENLLEAARKSRYLVFGTLAQRTRITRDTIAGLMEVAPGAIKFLDINLRKDCYTGEVLDASMRTADMLKTNHHELQELRKLAGIDAEEIPEIVEPLASHYELRTILVTMEEFGVFLYDHREGSFYLPGYEIELEDPLGAGDAFSAAFIHHTLRGASLVEACIRGNILGAAVATTKGATQAINESYLSKVIRKEKMHVRESLKEYIPNLIYSQ